MRLKRTAFLVMLYLFVAATAYAHITLQPRESSPGATVTYTVRVPTEGTVNTTAIELEVPDMMTIVSVDGPADAYETKLTGDRIVSITWKTDIPPKQFKTFTFTAKNPAMPSEISWKAHQKFADGTTFDWIEPAGGKRPAARTQVAATAERPTADPHAEHHKP